METIFKTPEVTIKINGKFDDLSSEAKKSILDEIQEWIDRRK